MKRIFALFLLLLGFLTTLFAQNQEITIRTEYNEAELYYRVLVTNNAIIPEYLTLDFTSLVNASPSVSMPYSALIPASTKDQELFRINVVAGERHSFRTSYSSQKGNPNAVHDDTYLYLLPFAHGTKQQLSQGNNGTFTHFGENQYAFDFDLAEGTGIYAARGGLVVEVKEDSRVGGPSPQYDQSGNFILIYHSDGSFGNYVHLRYNGAIPKVGDTVNAGDLIAYSGNTGYSSGPHLHFDVRLTKPDGSMNSIPITFLNTNGTALNIQAGLFYYASHPGKPGFPMVLGADLKNSDFANYRVELKNSNKIDIRAELIDNTYVLYAQNSSLKTVEMNLTLKLTNYQSSMPNPLKTLIPPQTEIFLCILQAVDLEAIKSGWESKFSYTFK